MTEEEKAAAAERKRLQQLSELAGGCTTVQVSPSEKSSAAETLLELSNIGELLVIYCLNMQEICSGTYTCSYTYTLTCTHYYIHSCHMDTHTHTHRGKSI